MSLGTAWGPVTGTISKEDSFKLLDGFYDAGGNFIDTSNNYHDEESETFVGEWMEARGIREQIVVATKVVLDVVLHYTLAEACCSTRAITSAARR